MPDQTGTGIRQPWRELPVTPVLVPSPAAAEISVQRALAAEALLDPRQLPVPAVGGALRGAAQSVLACAQSETLLRIAMHWAFASEVAHRPWAQNRDPLRNHSLSGPAENRHQMQRYSHRLVIPQLVRVIAMDTIYPHSSAGCETEGPSQLSAPLRTLVSEFFPSLERSEPPSHREIRTALWILSHDTPFADLGDGGPATLMAYTFGMQSIGEPQDSLRRWHTLVSLDDAHPHGSWVEGEAPSNLRSDLKTTSGLDLRDVATTVESILRVTTYFQNQSNQLFTLPSLVPILENAQGSSAEDALSFVSDHLVTSIDQLREAGCVGDGSLDNGGRTETLVDRRQAIDGRCIERPFFQFDDGMIVPVGLPDTVYGTIALCQEAHNDQNESAQTRRQRIGNILGRCFEAYVKDLCDTLGGSHHVIDSTTIDMIINQEVGRDSKRADLVIDDSAGNYLVLEITKRNLLGGIRYGDVRTLRRWIDEHLNKLAQVTSTVTHLHKITAGDGRPPPLRIARLVVADLPLRQDIGLSTLFDARSDNRQRPFLCGISEFEALVEKGRQGYSVPAIIHVWAGNEHDTSLGLFLSTYPFQS